MTTDAAALAVAAALDAAGVPYIIVGGYSSNTHGIPRATKDVDVVISISGYNFPHLLPLLGSQWSRDPQLTFETNTGTMREILELKGSPLKVELFARSMMSTTRSALPGASGKASRPSPYPFPQRRTSSSGRCGGAGARIWTMSGMSSSCRSASPLSTGPISAAGAKSTAPPSAWMTSSPPCRSGGAEKN